MLYVQTYVGAVGKTVMSYGRRSATATTLVPACNSALTSAAWPGCCVALIVPTTTRSYLLACWLTVVTSDELGLSVTSIWSTFG